MRESLDTKNPPAPAQPVPTEYSVQSELCLFSAAFSSALATATAFASFTTGFVFSAIAVFIAFRFASFFVGLFSVLAFFVGKRAVAVFVESLDHFGAVLGLAAAVFLAGCFFSKSQSRLS